MQFPSLTISYPNYITQFNTLFCLLSTELTSGSQMTLLLLTILKASSFDFFSLSPCLSHLPVHQWHAPGFIFILHSLCWPTFLQRTFFLYRLWPWLFSIPIRGSEILGDLGDRVGKSKLGKTFSCTAKGPRVCAWRVLHVHLFSSAYTHWQPCCATILRTMCADLEKYIYNKSFLLITHN